MVDTSDEWIMTRVGIRERRILKGEAQGVSVLGTRAVDELLVKTNTRPEEVDVVVFAARPRQTIRSPPAASMVAENCGIKNAFCFRYGGRLLGFRLRARGVQQLYKGRQVQENYPAGRR